MTAQTEVKAADNLRVWNALSKTDPAQTKGFSRAGGFKGTAVKPMWVIKRLTEEFGPCGEGWGIGEPRFEVVHGDNREVLVYCTVACWHGSPENILFGVGGDKIVTHIKANAQYNRPERWENDDEAFKKAFTDAVNNAFKFVGVAADIHMGLFDDSKYVDKIREEFEAETRQKVPGIAKIKKNLNELMMKGNAATDLEAFNTLVRGCADDLTTIKEANHAYWTGDGEDFEGYKAWIKRRREELSQPEASETFTMCLETMNACTSAQELQGWFKLNWKYVEELDGEEGRRIQHRYDELEAAFGAVETVNA